jgi:hypothetical protein
MTQLIKLCFSVILIGLVLPVFTLIFRIYDFINVYIERDPLWDHIVFYLNYVIMVYLVYKIVFFKETSKTEKNEHISG